MSRAEKCPLPGQGWRYAEPRFGRLLCAPVARALGDDGFAFAGSAGEWRRRWDMPKLRGRNASRKGKWEMVRAGPSTLIHKLCRCNCSLVAM